MREARVRLAAVEKNDPVEAARVRARIVELERAEAEASRGEPPADRPAVQRRPATQGRKRG